MEVLVDKDFHVHNKPVLHGRDMVETVTLGLVLKVKKSYTSA